MQRDNDFCDLLDDAVVVELSLETLKATAPIHLIPATFWASLSWPEQCERLSNLSALRPLLDEYTPESECQAFLQRHARDLLAQVPLEHLVPDPEGQLAADDVPHLANSLPAGTRYRLDPVPFLEQAHDWLSLWNQQKAGRAQYEERLFQTGRLGLQYSDGEGRWSQVVVRSRARSRGRRAIRK